jgi:hypothetical protein
VKILQDFVTSNLYNFGDSTFRRRVQAPVFTQSLGADILLPEFEPYGAIQADAWIAQRTGECKTEIRAIDASTGKAVTNFLRPPETLHTYA